MTCLQEGHLSSLRLFELSISQVRVFCSYAWHNSFVNVMSLVHTYDMTHPYLWRGLEEAHLSSMRLFELPILQCVCVRVYVHVCGCMCVCMCARARERERTRMTILLQAHLKESCHTYERDTLHGWMILHIFFYISSTYSTLFIYYRAMTPVLSTCRLYNWMFCCMISDSLSCECIREWDRVCCVWIGYQNVRSWYATVTFPAVCQVTLGLPPWEGHTSLHRKPKGRQVASNIMRWNGACLIRYFFLLHFANLSWVISPYKF